MHFPVHGTWKLTTDYHELRPLSKPPAERDHPHGAWDIGVPIGTVIEAPEPGRVYYHVIQRPVRTGTQNLYWPEDHVWYAFSNYWWDIWGGLILLEGMSGFTHVFAHIRRPDVFNLLQNRNFQYFERQYGEGHQQSWMNMNDPVPVDQGEPIGNSGNDGYSTGPHIHYEIHERRQWIAHGNRVDPADLFPDEYQDHRHEVA